MAACARELSRSLLHYDKCQILLLCNIFVRFCWVPAAVAIAQVQI